MAVLNKIRQRSIFLIGIIALALFAFVAADLFKGGGFAVQKQTTLGSVNGDDIERESFARKVDAQKGRFGPGASTTQVVNSVWEQEVRGKLMQAQYDELGLTVERERRNAILKDALQEDPRFQNEDGMYSEAKMREFVATLKANDPNTYAQWVDYENTLARNEQQNIYFNMIKAGLSATLTEGELAYNLEADIRDIEYVQVPFTSIPDEEVEVTKEDIKTYIKNHSDEYQTEAARSIQFVKFSEAATLGDEKGIETGLAAFLEDTPDSYNANDTIRSFRDAENAEEYVSEFSDMRFDDRFLYKSDIPQEFQEQLFNLEVGEVFGPYKEDGFYKLSKSIAVEQRPDSVQSSHILLPYLGLQNAGLVQRTRAESKALADSLAEVLKSSPSKMAELAKEFSSDNSKEKGGDLGYYTKNSPVVPEFKNYIFSNETGDIDVVESQFGYHVIQITDQKNEQRTVQLATIAKEIIPSQETIQSTFTAATKFQMAVDKNTSEFATIAKDSNYVVRPVNGIKELDENIPGEGAQREIVRWAFEEDTEKGAIERFQVEGGYLIVQLVSSNEAGLMNVETASGRVTPLVRKEKKAEIIKNKISGNDLQAIASAQSQTVKSASAVNRKNPTITGAGTEPAVVGAAFGLKEGAVSKPIVGERGVYVVKVTKVTPATSLDNYNSFAVQQGTSAKSSVNAKVPAALKEVAEIEDKRASVY
ncbi:MAG: peptidylprolyl isomerase [Leeuwenhoekiella sp.]